MHLEKETTEISLVCFAPFSFNQRPDPLQDSWARQQ